MDKPVVSAIMPTYNRRDFVRQAIAYFRRQDYPAPARELIVVDDGERSVADLAAEAPNVRYFRLDHRMSVGSKRNFACAQAQGEIIVHWDDDDWIAPHRISAQVGALGSADVCGLANVLYFDPQAGRAWEYRYPRQHRAWVSGNSMCYRKSFWEQNCFADIDVGEDARFLWSNRQVRVAECPDDGFLVGIIHGANVSPKSTGGSYWKDVPKDQIQKRIGADLPFYSSLGRGRRALVTAARGIGDILRLTPLVRVMNRLGYRVDVALEPDYAETVELLRGAPEIETLYWRSSPWARQRADHTSELQQQVYDVALFTTWSVALRPLIKASQVHCFDRNTWMQNGDRAEVERLARHLGWQDELPPPFAMTSGRSFELPKDTIALHPGCKPDWPWKKWHGFDELARSLPEVAVVGTPADLNNAGTYFQRSFDWPAHARNYIGQLSLLDTTALLQQCAGLVSNDSGMMHLAVALGIPTWGIFGITDPRREGVAARNFFAITKGLSCEPACRKERFGRRDCEHHLECMRTLEPAEVLHHIRPAVAVSPAKEQPMAHPQTAEVGLVYHGEVFNPSGYGAAARAYVHALHEAGVRVSVVNTGGAPADVRDPLIESLLGGNGDADFHLFHGIPTRWAQQAFRCSNAIGMTVWETDTMPTQWASTLNHVMEVWLPCEHNIAAFQRGVTKPLFKLPHAFREPSAPVQDRAELEGWLRVRPDDFVIYSIFEWQERKMPLGQLTAYLRAFPDDGAHSLVMKVNAGAAAAAEAAIQEARRNTKSSARVEVFAEGWSNQQIDALHQRGDCYLSLHRGEGWCYPLFDAVCRGTAAVATGYSGPLDYLSAENHELIRYRMAPVTQRYVYYHPRMQWADPDLDHAAERLRWVFENRALAAARARAGAEALRARYASQTVGEMARQRLLEIKGRTVARSRPQPQPASRSPFQRPVAAAPFRSIVCEPRRVAAPPVPVPATWYGADYFEHGVTSNWKNGYHWENFQGLFRAAAAFLLEMFPESSSFLDAGCAKGFLVRALREKQKEAWGFDVSGFAIERAGETSAYLRVAGVDDVQWEQPVDVLVAMDLFSHLTEAQASAFLKRARGWTRMGLLATIPTVEDFRAGNRDLTHVTRQNRKWWHNLFREAGWHQDDRLSALQRSCQHHALAVSMRWNIFCYAPQ
jgi:ADP-heptose:LPS heptosyltransferase